MSASSASSVWVVTTGRTVFGVHRARGVTSQTHVVGFWDPLPARALAVSLQKHHETHGAFPARDSGIAHAELDCADFMTYPLTTVAVEEWPLSAALARLDGTGIVLSTLAGGPDAFKWVDMNDGGGLRDILKKLEWTYEQPYDAFVHKPN